MVSLKSSIMFQVFKWKNLKQVAKVRMETGAERPRDFERPMKEMYNQFTIHVHQVQNHNVYTLEPKESDKSGIYILYLHGGAYISTFTKKHWDFIGTLVDQTNGVVIAPDYPLAPQNTYKEAVGMVEDLYRDLAKNTEMTKLVLMGDSAGAGLALALAQKLKDEKIRQVDQIILLSPWLDVLLKSPGIEDINKIDPYLEPVGLRLAGMAYAGDTDPKHYLISPLYGNLNGLRRISIFTGTRDILYPEAKLLKEKAIASNVEVDFIEYVGMIHVWMLFKFKESLKATKQILKLILEK